MNQGIRHEFDIPRNYGFIEIGQRLLAKVVFTDGQSNRQTDRQTGLTITDHHHHQLIAQKIRTRQYKQ